MNTVVDLHILRLTLRQNLICPAWRMKITLEMDIQHVFLEVISHYAYGVKEEMDLCHVTFPGPCMNSSLQVDHLSKYPLRSIQIIIKLTPKERCQHCFLHVRLWENQDLKKRFRDPLHCMEQHYGNAMLLYASICFSTTCKHDMEIYMQQGVLLLSQV